MFKNMRFIPDKGRISLAPIRIFLILLFSQVSFADNAQREDFLIETGYALVNDISMYYASYGDVHGDVLILLHGGLGNADYWSNQIAALSHEYNVITLDSRGHGRSTFDTQQITYSLMANDVIAFMDYMGIDKANIVGWSNGGNIAIDLAINNPNRLLRVVAYGANFSPAGVRSDIGKNDAFNAYLYQAAIDYLALSPAPGRFIEFFLNISVMWKTEPNFTDAQMKGITTPIMILDGYHDEAINIQHTIDMAEKIHGAKLKLIKNTGHFAPYEKIRKFNNAVLNFLGKGRHHD